MKNKVIEVPKPVCEALEEKSNNSFKAIKAKIDELVSTNLMIDGAYENNRKKIEELNKTNEELAALKARNNELISTFRGIDQK